MGEWLVWGQISDLNVKQGTGLSIGVIKMKWFHFKMVFNQFLKVKM
jgi:hypothetical protein